MQIDGGAQCVRPTFQVYVICMRRFHHGLPHRHLHCLSDPSFSSKNVAVILQATFSEWSHQLVLIPNLLYSRLIFSVYLPYKESANQYIKARTTQLSLRELAVSLVSFKLLSMRC